MARILDIDLGNTRLKWRWQNAGEIAASGAFAYGADDTPSLPATVTAVDRVRIASVVRGSRFERLLTLCRTEWQLEPEVASVQPEWAGVTQGYDDLRRLGVDRWLAMLAVHNRYRCASVVVSSGSAITVDLLQADGVHRGGYIVPGLEMMRRALYAGTSAIKLDALEPPPSLEPGRDTVEAVNAGLLAMICALIDNAAQRLRSTAGTEPAVIVTGGAGEQLQTFLGEQSVYNPHLVLDGLALALP